MPSTRNKQTGFSLFIVMIVMLVIALLVIVTNQSSSTEMRMSANDADRKYAFSMAEGGLRDAETRLQEIAVNINPDTPLTFTPNCTQGFCSPVEPVKVSSPKPLFKVTPSPAGTLEAWKRPSSTNSAKTLLDDDQAANSIKGTANGTRYIIEYLGDKSIQGTNQFVHHFRVTARGKGQNPNTVVTLQSYVEMTPPQK